MYVSNILTVELKKKKSSWVYFMLNSGVSFDLNCIWCIEHTCVQIIVVKFVYDYLIFWKIQRFDFTLINFLKL